MAGGTSLSIIRSLIVITILATSCVNGKHQWNSSSSLSEIDMNSDEAHRSRRLIEIRNTHFNIEKAPAPLFKDPIFDGAADPTVIWYFQCSFSFFCFIFFLLSLSLLFFYYIYICV